VTLQVDVNVAAIIAIIIFPSVVVMAPAEAAAADFGLVIVNAVDAVEDVVGKVAVEICCVFT
jgi:hypothetical protein